MVWPAPGSRVYDAVQVPNGITRARSSGQPASPRSRVLVDPGYGGVFTIARERIPLLKHQLWTDTNYTRATDTTLWEGGTIVQGSTPGVQGGDTPFT